MVREPIVGTTWPGTLSTAGSLLMRETSEVLPVAAADKVTLPVAGLPPPTVAGVNVTAVATGLRRGPVPPTSTRPRAPAFRRGYVPGSPGSPGSEDAERDLRGGGEEVGDLVVQADQGHRRAGHVQRGAVLADVGAADLDAPLGE